MSILVDILAVIGAATVLLIAWIVLDPHRHRCACGNTWSHCGLWNGRGETSPWSVRSHTCGRCGALQWSSNVRWWSP